LYTELFYAIIPTLFLCFLLICIPTSCYIFNVFYSCIYMYTKFQFLNLSSKDNLSPFKEVVNSQFWGALWQCLPFVYSPWYR